MQALARGILLPHEVATTVHRPVAVVSDDTTTPPSATTVSFVLAMGLLMVIFAVAWSGSVNSWAVDPLD